MKKLFLITMLVAVASMFTACENKDNNMAQDLKGTWEGFTYMGEDKYPADYQFFPDAESNTGKFLDIDYFNFTETIEDDTYEISYIAYAGGSYTVKDGKLYLDYNPETAWVWIDEEAVTEYVMAFLEYDSMYGDGEWQEEDPEEIVEYYINTQEESIGPAWEKVITDFNTGMNSGYGNLKVSNDQFSYTTSDLGELVFTKAAEELFDEYPF